MTDGVHRVVAGVVVRDGAILLCLRSATKKWYPRVWDLPGGHIESGETSEIALARELREELGIDAQADPEVLAALSGPGLDLILHRVTQWTGTIRNAAPDEHDTLGFFTPAQAEQLTLADAAYVPLIGRVIAAPPR